MIRHNFRAVCPLRYLVLVCLAFRPIPLLICFLDICYKHRRHMLFPVLCQCTKDSVVAPENRESIKNNVDAVNEDGDTALIIAARQGHSQVVSFLLRKGANYDFQAADGSTALAIAVAGNHMDVCSSLLETNAGLDIADNNGDTPLILACRSGNIILCEKLIESKAILDTRNKVKNSALMCAITQRRTEICEILIDKGANIKMRNIWGDDSLILAARYGVEKVVPKLLSKDADVNVTNHYRGVTALMTAIASKHHAIALQIASTGKVNTKLRNKEGNTTLQCAASVGWLDVCEKLVADGDKAPAPRHCLQVKRVRTSKT